MSQDLDKLLQDKYTNYTNYYPLYNFYCKKLAEKLNETKIN